MRITLANLLIAFAVFGLLLSAMAWPNPLWTGVLLAITLTCFWGTALAAIVVNSSRRWSCLGFALTGFAYITLAIWFGESTRPHLATHHALEQLDQWTQVSVPELLPNGGWGYYRPDGQIEIYHSEFNRPLRTTADARSGGYLDKVHWSVGTVPTAENFYLNGHLAWAWLLAIAGGWFTAWRARRGVAATVQSDVPSDIR